MESHTELFAYDAKIYRVMARFIDPGHNWPGCWAVAIRFECFRGVDWRLASKLRSSKCRIMDCGSSNSNTSYVMEEISGVQTALNVTSDEKDLGVYVTNNLKPTTVSRRLTGRYQHFENWRWHSVIRLAKKNLKFWALHTSEHILSIAAQRRAAMMVNQLKHLPYKEC